MRELRLEKHRNLSLISVGARAPLDDVTLTCACKGLPSAVADSDVQLP